MKSSPGDSRDVLIVGASARAAVQSARRAGLVPWAVDFFGDEDLRRSAVAYRNIENYRQLPAAIDDWPGMPWLGTGAVENHPRLIERLSQRHPHWGNTAEVMRAVRCPHRLRQALEEAGKPALRIWRDTTPPPLDGRWVLKPWRTAGGQNIRIWDKQTADLPETKVTLHKPHIFQQRAEGTPMSALFLSAGEQVSLVGISRLLVRNVPAQPFGFAGAIGPVSLPSDQEQALAETGRLLGQSFALRGLWGMDFLHDGTAAWITEINPRYTATVELYEHAWNLSLLALHRQVFEDGALTSPLLRKTSSLIIGKIVVYTEHDLTIPPWQNWIEARDALLPGLPGLADRPAEGSQVPRGQPVCTLFAAGTSEAECQSALHQRTQELQAHFQQAGQRLR